MSEQITVAILRNMVKNLNRKAGTSMHDAYVLESSYGKQQLYQCAPDSLGGYTARHRISPLLSKSALHTWLWAYMDGMDAGYARGYAAGLGAETPLAGMVSVSD